jgi:hypothetical protein
MRRSCSSAVFVGLCLTQASAAFAQDSEQPSTTPSPSDPGTTQTEEPTATPVAPPPPPAADIPATAAPVIEQKPKPRPFEGSALYNQNSMTTGTIFRGQQQDYNPTVESSLWLLPRYAINDAFQFRGRVIVYYEYTNSDTTTYQNEPVLSDASLQLYYRKIPNLPGGIKPLVALNTSFPTSKTSRARTLIFSPGATLQLSRGWENVLGGEALFLGSVIYSHPIYESANPEVVDNLPYKLQCMGGIGCGDMITGQLNPSDTLAYTAMFGMTWGKWNPAIYYLGATQWVYTPKDVRNPVDGTPIGRPPGFEPTGIRQTHYVSLWLDYNFNSWFTAEVGYWNSVTSLGDNGRYANFLFDRYQDTRVYVGASFQLDNLVKVLQGAGEGEAGVVRAQNTTKHPPMWRF